MSSVKIQPKVCTSRLHLQAMCSDLSRFSLAMLRNVNLLCQVVLWSIIIKLISGATTCIYIHRIGGIAFLCACIAVIHGIGRQWPAKWMSKSRMMRRSSSTSLKILSTKMPLLEDTCRLASGVWAFWCLLGPPPSSLVAT